MQSIAKKGITINEFTGTKTRYIVEFDDGTAAIYDDWSTAYQAGSFADDEAVN